MKKVKIISIILVTLLTFVSLSACANTPTLYKVEPMERIEGIEYGDKQPSRFAEDMTQRVFPEYKYESYILDWLLTTEGNLKPIIMDIIITDWVGEYQTLSVNSMVPTIGLFKAQVLNVFSDDKELLDKTIIIQCLNTSQFTFNELPSYAIGNRFLIFANKKEDASTRLEGATGSYYGYIQPSAEIDIVTCSDGKEYLIRWHSDFKSENADKFMITDQEIINMVMTEFTDKIMLQAKQERSMPYYIYPYEEIKDYMSEVRGE